MKPVIVGLAALALIGMTPPVAQAIPSGTGCERVNWGFLGLTQKRDICDGPRQSDGSWLRTRYIFVPAGYVSASSSCSYYSCTYHPGYYHEESTVAFEQYVVFDDNVPPGEPPWLPTGSMVIR